MGVPESVCVVQVAAGDEFVSVSDLTLPGKSAWASAHGYRVLNYVFDDLESLPQCCADVDSFACSLTNVQIKYCVTLDALTTGGAGSVDGNSAGGACDYVMTTDADAVFSPFGPSLDEFVAPVGDGSRAPAVAISALDPTATAETGWRAVATTLETLETFNSGVMVFRNSREALDIIESVLAFDDSTFDGEGSCSHDVFGYGDQWSLCGAATANPALLDSVAAFTHPKKLQRAVLWTPGSEEPVDGALLDIAAADWPEDPDDEAFVVNCAGAFAETCATFFITRLGAA